MVNYREIIRLKSLEYSNARVASSCGSSRNTVAEVWQLAERKELIWPIPDTANSVFIEPCARSERAINALTTEPVARSARATRKGGSNNLLY